MSVVGTEQTSASNAGRWPVLAATGLALVATLITALFAVLIAWVSFYDVPYWDHWSFVDRDTLLTDPLRRNNEHLMIVDELFFWLDALLFSSTGRFLQLIIMTSLIAQVALFGWLASMLGGRPLVLGAVFVSAVFVLGAFSFEVMFWSFELSLVLCFTASLAAFALLARHVTGPSPVLLALSFLAATLSALSFANGALVPVLLGLMALALGRRGLAVGFAVLAVPLLALQLSGSGDAASAFAFDKLPEIVIHFLVQLGGAAGFASGYAQKIGLTLPTPIMALFAGGAAFLLATAALVWIALYRRRDPVLLALAGVILFALGTAGVTALARHPWGIEQALSSRYNVNTALLWSAVAITGFRAFSDAPAALKTAASWASVVAALGLIVFAMTGRPVLTNLGERHREAIRGLTALVAGAPDRDSIARVAHSYDPAIAMTQTIREQHTFMFAAASARRIDDTLSPDEIAAPPCEKSRWAVRLHEGFQTAEGGVARTKARAGARHILIANPSGTVIGYGQIARRASDLNPFAATDGAVVDWSGHLRGGERGPLHAWLADDHRVRCSLGEGGLRVDVSRFQHHVKGALPAMP